jgi:hypothetical protein
MPIGIQDMEDSLNAARGLFFKYVLCNICEEYTRTEMLPVNVVTKIALYPPSDAATC